MFLAAVQNQKNCSKKSNANAKDLTTKQYNVIWLVFLNNNTNLWLQ